MGTGEHGPKGRLKMLNLRFDWNLLLYVDETYCY